MTGLGFRAMASTCLNEQGWHPDVIDLQLAYNRAERMAAHASWLRSEHVRRR